MKFIPANFSAKLRNKFPEINLSSTRKYPSQQRDN